MRRLFRSALGWGFVLVWAVTMGFWGASYLRVGTGWHVTYGAGAVCLFYLPPETSMPFATEAFDQAPDHSSWWVWQHLTAGAITADHGRAGFRLRTGQIDRNQFNRSADAPFTYRLAEVPFWFLAVLTAVPAAVAFGRGRRGRARADQGRCFDCGYDLRGVTGRCPECGTLPPAGAVTATR